MAKFALVLYMSFALVDLLLFYIMIMRTLKLSKNKDLELRKNTQDKYYYCKIIFVVMTPIINILSCAVFTHIILCKKEKFEKFFN